MNKYNYICPYTHVNTELTGGYVLDCHNTQYASTCTPLNVISPGAYDIFSKKLKCYLCGSLLLQEQIISIGAKPKPKPADNSNHDLTLTITQLKTHMEQLALYVENLKKLTQSQMILHEQNVGLIKLLKKENLKI